VIFATVILMFWQVPFTMDDIYHMAIATVLEISLKPVPFTLIKSSEVHQNSVVRMQHDI